MYTKYEQCYFNAVNYWKPQKYLIMLLCIFFLFILSSSKKNNKENAC